MKEHAQRIQKTASLRHVLRINGMLAHGKIRAQVPEAAQKSIRDVFAFAGSRSCAVLVLIGINNHHCTLCTVVDGQLV